MVHRISIQRVFRNLNRLARRSFSRKQSRARIETWLQLILKDFVLAQPRSRDEGFGTGLAQPVPKVQEAIRKLLGDRDAKEKAVAFAEAIAGSDGPKLAARRLYERYGHASP